MTSSARLRLSPPPRPLVDRETYLREGYVVVRGVLDPAELEALNAEMGELYALQLRRLGLPVDPGGSREALLANAARLLAVDVETYINTARMTQMIARAHQIMASDAILDLVRALGLAVPVISTRLSNHIMSEVLKIPGGYHKSPPHQDWRSMQGSLDSVVLWAPTTPVTERSHPLEVVPRSHLLGLLDTAEHIMTPTVSDPRITDDRYVALPMQPGDVVAFSSFLVHRTGEAGDGQLRIAFSTRYNNAAEPTYLGHGYPTPYKYSYRTDLMVPDFPKASDLKRVFPDVADGD
jgi:ectoine hydroxylase-related dioxygenase (phytanoyl-CoA dioxygenase family)